MIYAGTRLTNSRTTSVPPTRCSATILAPPCTRTRHRVSVICLKGGSKIEVEPVRARQVHLTLHPLPPFNPGSNEIFSR